MIGGKWTTCRAFAEETADAVLAVIGRTRRRSTRFEAIGGGRGRRAAWLRDFAGRHGVPEAQADLLLDRYGTSAERIAEAGGAGLREPLASLPDYSRGEMAALMRAEQVAALAEDLVFRRTPLAVSGRLTRAAIDELAGVAAAELGWGAAEEADEVARTVALAQDRHGVGL